MQRFTLLLSLFIVAATASFAQTADEAELKKLIESETEAFTRMSLADVCKTYWTLDENSILNVTILGGNVFQIKKEDVVQNTEAPPAGHAVAVKSNFHYVIIGDMASATYDQVVTITETGDKVYSRELHIFHRVNGVWKIHLSSVHQFTP